MENDIVGIINPYAKLLPETISNNIIDYTSPTAIHNAYNYGMINGTILNNDQTPYPYRKFAQYNFDFLKANQEDNESIFFEDTKYYGQIKDSGKGKRILHYKAGMQIMPKIFEGAQGTGDCVSWAIRAALDELRCLNILNGEWEDFIVRQATCAIYAGRNHTGQGADPVGLSAWAVKIGTLLEQVYKTAKNTYDFTDYKNYMRWGISQGRVGVPSDLLEVTKPYTAGGYKIVRTTDALLDAMANGGTAHCGSNLSVSSYGDPISPRTRQGWSHDMYVSGVLDDDETKEKYGSRIWIWDQSWGNWNKVTNIPEEWKPWPQGAFAVTDDTCSYGVRAGGTVVFIPGKWFPVKDFSNSII